MTGRQTPQNRCLPLVEWPPADRAAWDLANRPPDPLEPAVGFASRWAPSTRRQIENAYGRWLGWLAQTDQLDPLAGPADRPTRERASAYLRMLTDAGLADYTRAGRLRGLYDALRAMAPEGDWKWIGLGGSRIHTRAKPGKDIDARLRPPGEILELGLNMMAEAEDRHFSYHWEGPALYRDGLAIAFLIHRPLRVQNLAGIQLNRHLHRRGEEWWVAFMGTEMKGKRPIQFPWPAILAEALERYLKVYRPVLLDGGPDDGALWITRTGTPMPAAALRQRISYWTKEAFGASINPHSFRHVAATTIATAAPENVTDAARVLGHADLRTTEAHYIRSKGAKAADAYHAAVAAERKALGRR